MTVLAGQPLLAADVIAERDRFRFIQKSGTQTHTSTTTLENDNELTCSMEANSVYEVRVQASIGGTAGDIQTAWSCPVNASGSKMCVGPDAASTDRTNTNVRMGNHAFATAVTYGVNDASALAFCIEVGRVVTTDAGTFTWQHAQASSSASPSNVGQNTYMAVTKVS